MLLEDPALDDPLEQLGLTRRDRAILALARTHAAGAGDFAEALRALREATARFIPAGRVYYLGQHGGEPVVGSIISGVGITASARGIEIVRVVDGMPSALGTWTLR